MGQKDPGEDSLPLSFYAFLSFCCFFFLRATLKPLPLNPVMSTFMNTFKALQYSEHLRQSTFTVQVIEDKESRSYLQQ